MNAKTCTACKALAPMGIRCNHHRTESSTTRIVRQATEAGHEVTGTRIEQALQAEKILGARPVYAN